jgi:hypothetical protein
MSIFRKNSALEKEKSITVDSVTLLVVHKCHSAFVTANGAGHNSFVEDACLQSKSKIEI